MATIVSACTTKAPVDDADPEGSLTTAAREPGFLDPQQSSNVNDIPQVTMVFEPLLRLDPKSLRPIPGAAKDLPEISADGLTYRLTIREESKYSDGTPVRARDYVYGVTRLCDPGLKAVYASVAYLVIGCAEWNHLDPDKDPAEKHRAAKQKLTSSGIRATGERELTITLTEPAVYFSAILTLWVFTPIRESDVIRGGEEWWRDPATYVGNGPFVLSAWKFGDRMVFTPNRYYRSPAKLKQWTKLFIAESAVALNAYRHDELDAFSMTGLLRESPLVEGVLSDRSISDQILRKTDLCTSYLAFNQRRPPFDDAAVRLAFAKAIDRDAYVREALGGLATPALSLIAPGLPGHDPSDDVQRFDPEAARRLLASSKYGSSSLGPISIPIDPRNLDRRTRLESLRDQWQRHLGVEVTLEPLERQLINQRYRKTETIPQVTLSGWCADYPDQQNWLSLLFHSTSTQGPVYNTGFSNAEFDRVVAQADKERDQATRDALYRQASRMLSSAAVVAFLSNSQTIWLRKTWVDGIVDSAWDIDPGMVAGYERVFVRKRGR